MLNVVLYGAPLSLVGLLGIGAFFGWASGDLKVGLKIAGVMWVFTAFMFALGIVAPYALWAG